MWIAITVIALRAFIPLSYASSESEKTPPTKKIINGCIQLGHHNYSSNILLYCNPHSLPLGLSQVVDDDGKQLKLSYSDVLARVKISGSGEQWMHSWHEDIGMLPDYLPLKLLEGKFENDFVTLHCINHYSREIHTLQLQCKEPSLEDFGNVLVSCKYQFAFLPQYDQTLLRQLLSHRILIRNNYAKADAKLFWNPSRNAVYVHGPNGYKITSPTQDDEEK